MKILVIGSEGNIGRPLVQLLRERGHEVLRCDLEWIDINDYVRQDVRYPLGRRAFHDFAPDVVYHLVALVGRVNCEEDPQLAVDVNVAGTSNVVQLCKELNARMINFSTSDVYGNAGGILCESDQPLYQNNRYGLTKYLAEKIVEYEAYNNGLKAVTLRPFMLYSENETKAHYRSAMIRFAMDLVEGKGVTVYEYTWRSWLHIDDAVVAFANAAELDCTYYDVINIGHSELISALDLVKRMLMILGKSEDLITEKKLPKTIAGYKRPGLEKQKGLLGFEPKVELQDGVERLIQNLLEAKNATA